eukprot:6194056-Pleurochrysis_carterae.AAC.1
MIPNDQRQPRTRNTTPVYGDTDHLVAHAIESLHSFVETIVAAYRSGAHQGLERAKLHSGRFESKLLALLLHCSDD